MPLWIRDVISVAIVVWGVLQTLLMLSTRNEVLNLKLELTEKQAARCQECESKFVLVRECALLCPVLQHGGKRA